MKRVSISRSIIFMIFATFFLGIAGCGSGGGNDGGSGQGASGVQDPSYYTAKLQQFELHPPQEGQPQYLGDSNTEGLFGISRDSNIPEVKALSERYFDGGISGDTSLGVLNRILFHLYYKPKKLAVNIITNDIEFGTSFSAVRNYRRILALAKDGGVEKFYIISILPRPTFFASANKTTRKINDELRLLAEENSEWVEYVDVFSLFDGHDEFFKDPWHLTHEGFEILAKALNEKLL